MGRAKSNTQALNFRIDGNIISKLMASKPSLVSKDLTTGKLKFRHGALGRYIARLILEDLDKAKAAEPENTLSKFKQELSK